MSNGGIRLADLILPALAGGAAAISPRAGRGVAVGLGALGGVMQQREMQAARAKEEMRLQEALAQEKAKHDAKLESGRRLFESITATSSAPPEASKALGIQQPRFDPVSMSIARARLEMGEVDGAMDMLAKARLAEDKPRLPIETLRERARNLGPGEKFSAEVEGGGSYTYDAPEPKPQKAVERTVDFGNMIRTYFTDGTTKEEPKGAPPSSRASGGKIADMSPAVARLAEGIAARYDANPLVRRYQIAAEGLDFTKRLDINSKSSADDQGLIYAYAKAMDPESAVREGEYASIQKYAGSLADRLGFNAKRLLTGAELLTPQARANLKRTIESKYQSHHKSYTNYRKQTAARIDRYTEPGFGESYLTSYELEGDGEQGQGGAPASFDSPEAVRAAMQSGQIDRAAAKKILQEQFGLQ
jgi:hypothetical protein